MTDIRTRADIELLLRAFYTKALADPVIGFFFTEVVPLDMEKHIPLITEFWESVLFGEKAYNRNVLEIHRHIHHLSAFREEHFRRWLELFTGTVHEMFAGDKAVLACQRAESIATIIKMKTVYGKKL